MNIFRVSAEFVCLAALALFGAAACGKSGDKPGVAGGAGVESHGPEEWAADGYDWSAIDAEAGATANAPAGAHPFWQGDPEAGPPPLQGGAGGRPVFRLTPSDSVGVFVDAANGDDANAGTMAAPLRSLQWAAKLAYQQNKSVFVAGGRYDESFFTKADVYCGYASGTWEFDPASYPTTITATSQPWAVYVPSGFASRIDRCEIYGGATTDYSSYGVVVHGQALLTGNKIVGLESSLYSLGVHGNVAGCRIEAYNNIIIAAGPSDLPATAVRGFGCDVKLVQNTLIARNQWNGTQAFTAAPGGGTALLVNNILDGGSGYQQRNRAVRVIWPATATLAGNLLVSSGPALVSQEVGVSWDVYRTVEEVNDCGAWASYCMSSSDNQVAAEVGFVDEAKGDYRLLNSSPAVEGGVDLATYDPSGLAEEDVNGDYRPVGDKPEIGAIELYVKDIKIYSNFACSLLSNNFVKCWGNGANGRLGDGLPISSSIYSYLPGEVVKINTDNKQLTIGTAFACVLTTTNGVKCWGQGKNLGNGSSQTDMSMPISVYGLTSNVIKIVSDGHSCALMIDGTVKCWGYNDVYQLGDGTNTSDFYPLTVPGLNHKAIDIAVGHYHSCALLETGAVKCWGWNQYGQLGIGSGYEYGYTPTDVIGLGGPAVEIDAYDYYTCARLADGSVKCWGSSVLNRLLGADSGDNFWYPTDVGPQRSLRPVFRASYGGCVLMFDGGVECWGANGYGQLAVNAWYDAGIPQQPVQGLKTPAVEIMQGSYTVCALLETGEVQCWGSDEGGLVGHGANKDYSQDSPIEVGPFPASVVDIDGGGLFTCALLDDDDVYCWGMDVRGQIGYGQLGYGPYAENIGLPLRVDLPGPAALVTAGDYHACARLDDGSIYCWGSNTNGKLGTGGALVKSVIPVYASAITGTPEMLVSGCDETFGVYPGGQLKSWYDTPQVVENLSEGVAQVAPACNNTCVLTTDNKIKCWNYFVPYDYYYGGIPCCLWCDDDYRIETPSYRRSSLWGDIEKLASAGFFEGYQQANCALLKSGYVNCWAELCGGSSVKTGITNAVDIDGGYTENAFCVILDDGGVKCWIYDGDPYTVNLGEPAVKVAAGMASCALLESGKVKCWGDYRACGVGDSETYARPVNVELFR